MREICVMYIYVSSSITGNFVCHIVKVVDIPKSELTKQIKHLLYASGTVAFALLLFVLTEYVLKALPVFHFLFHVL